MGLREDKKAQTRKRISDLATILFCERGFDSVTTAEIAEKAGVSAKTLFNYFPTKESLVFDDDEKTEAELIAAVRDRKKGQKILAALLELGCKSIDELKDSERQGFGQFMRLIESTPALQNYFHQMWARHATALALIIRKESKSLSKEKSQAVARFVLDSFHRAMGAPQPKATLRSLFELIENGWKE